MCICIGQKKTELDVLMILFLIFCRSVYICLSNKTRYILWASFHCGLSTSGRISLFHSLMVGYSHTFNVGVSLQVSYFHIFLGWLHEYSFNYFCLLLFKIVFKKLKRSTIPSFCWMFKKIHDRELHSRDHWTRDFFF